MSGEMNDSGEVLTSEKLFLPHPRDQGGFGWS